MLSHFNSEKLNQLIFDGGESAEDLQFNDPNTQMNIITDLIAIQSGERIRKKIIENRFYWLNEHQQNKEIKLNMNIVDFVTTPILATI